MKMKRTTLMQQETGQALVIIVFVILGMVILAALAIDGGNALVQRRTVQNGADNCALAGIRNIVIDEGLTETELLAEVNLIAEANGIPDTDDTPGNSINTNVEAHYTDMQGNRLTGCDLVGSCSGIPNETFGIECSTQKSVPTYFAAILGWNSIEASASGIAVNHVPTTANYYFDVETALWSWGYTDLNGQDPIIDGVFANGVGCPGPDCETAEDFPINNSGQDPQIEPVVCTSPNCFECTGQGCETVPNSEVPPTSTFPFVIDFATYAPGGQKDADYWPAGKYSYVDNGTNNVHLVPCEEGVYVVTGNAHLKVNECGKPTFKKITIIALGWIRLDADAWLEPFDASLDGLVLASWSESAPENPNLFDSTTAAIDFNQNPELKGLLYGPNGNVGDTGQDLHLDGAVVAETITIDGQNVIITFNPSYFPPGPPPTTIELIQ